MRLQPGPGQFGGELVRDGPAGGGGAEAEPAPAGQGRSPCRPRRRCHSQASRAAPRSRGTAPAAPRARRRARSADWSESPSACRRAMAPICVAASGSDSCAPGIGEEAQRARGGDRGVQLAQRPGGGVARVGKGLVARCGLPGVQGGEIGVATCRPRRAPPARRARRSARCGISAMVRAFSVTFSPTSPSPRVAACTSTPAFIAQRQRQPVDLRLGGDRPAAPSMPKELAHAVVEIGHLARRRRRSPGCSIRTACGTLPKPSASAAPTWSEGLSARFSAGNRASIAALRRFSAS